MSPAADTPEAPSKVLPKGMFSFKVLTECPIIVVLLFQSHRRYAGENIMRFVPLIFQVSFTFHHRHHHVHANPPPHT